MIFFELVKLTPRSRFCATFQKRYFQHSLKAAWKLCVMMRQPSIPICEYKFRHIWFFTINKLFANDTQDKEKINVLIWKLQWFSSSTQGV